MRICNAFLIATVCTVTSSAQDQIVDLFPDVVGMAQSDIKSPAQSPVVMRLSKPKPISATESTVTVTLKMAKGVKIYASPAAEPALEYLEPMRLRVKLNNRDKQPIAVNVRFPKPIGEQSPLGDGKFFVYRDHASIRVTYKTDDLPVVAQIRYLGFNERGGY